MKNFKVKDFPYLHCANENGREDFDGVHASDQDLSMDLMRQFHLPAIHILGHSRQPRGDVLEKVMNSIKIRKMRKNLDELAEVVHGLNDLGDGQIVEHFSAHTHYFAHLRLVEAEQQLGGAWKMLFRRLCVIWKYLEGCREIHRSVSSWPNSRMGRPEPFFIYFLSFFPVFTLSKWQASSNILELTSTPKNVSVCIDQ
jgi:hypothetical protein